MIRGALAIALLAVVIHAGAATHADRYLLLVSGISGEAYYADRFDRWAGTLRDVAIQHLNIAPDRLIYLAESHESAPGSIAARSSKANVLAAVADVAKRSRPGDMVLVMLIGHGTASGERALFNLPGPDLSAAELAGALDALAGRQVAVVNGAPASAPFINALSATGRIVITATSSAAENQHTRFAGQFSAAFAVDAADADKDKRVSLLEAFRYARREVERSFELDGRLVTEHALLDDNGDGLGSPDPDPRPAGDGALARRFYLESEFDGAAEDGPGRERLALQIEAQRLVDRVEALKRLKLTLDSAQYEQRLEDLLVELALNRRAYRARTTP